MTDLPDMDFDYQPPVAQSYMGNVGGVSEIINENIARIESIKLKTMTCSGLTEMDRLGFFQELDVLRGAFVQVGNLVSQQSTYSGQFYPHKKIENKQNDLVGEGILGRSDAILKILKVISKMASTNLTLLLEGETGVGKELYARIVHINSKREKFVALNCGAFPSELIESELFGHVKGAYTGANSERKGKFDEADGGTIFLDEIGELDLSAQVKLLRVLEVGEIQRVGSDRMHKIDVRVIAATNRNLELMVGDNKFREDLYYRLNMCPIFIPPLRERRDEIDILMEYFMQEVSAKANIPMPLLSSELKHFLFNKYNYPGNIRELKNLAQYMVFIADDCAVTLEDLPDRYQHDYPIRKSDQNTMIDVRDDAEKKLLEKLLKEKRGNIIQICDAMNLSRSRVYQLLQKHGLQPINYK